MELQQEQSWNCLTQTLVAGLPVKEAWEKLISFHEQLLSQPSRERLHRLNLIPDKTNLIKVIERLVADEPLPQEVVALWIGMVKLSIGEKVVTAIYLAGADHYSKEDVDWACNPVYFPDNRYFYLSALQEIDDIIQAEEKYYGYLDWILPIACSALLFQEILQEKLDIRLLLANRSEIQVAIGYDDGDYVDLTPLTNSFNV